MAKNNSTTRFQIRFTWKAALCVSLLFSLLIKLGFWQLSRAEEKRQLQRALLERQQAAPIPIEEISWLNKKELPHRRISLTGSYLNDRLILIPYKHFQGRLGYEVITPFQLKSKRQIVFVSRGWAPANHESDALPHIEPIDGEQALIAEIYVPSGKAFFLTEPVQGKGWPLRVHHFNMEGFKDLFQKPLFPYLVRLAEGNPGILERFWPKVDFKAERSTAYAIQWFGLALVLIVGSVIAGTNITELIRSK